MVELRREIGNPGPVVTGFTPDGFKIGDEQFGQGLLLSPENAINWEAPQIDRLDFDDIYRRIKLTPKPEFLLFGSGTDMQQPPPSFCRAAKAAGLGVEAMDSKAAARTWGVLRAEDRWIIGVLMPLS